MEENKTNLVDFLYEVAKQKRDYILNDSSCGTKENSQATEEFIKCMNLYRELQKDADDAYLEEKRIKNEEEANRKAEVQKDRYDTVKLVLEGVATGATVVGLIMSFVTLHEYQEINLNSVVTNKDAVKAADNLFTSLFRRVS